MFKVHKLVREPYRNMTVFEQMVRVFKDMEHPGKHKIFPLASGSDYASFYQIAGVPSITVGYDSHIW